MELRKLAAIGFSAAVLAAQAYVVLPGVPKFGDWYFPFIDYPMYAVPRYADEPVRLHHLVVRPCVGSDGEEQLSHRDLGIRMYALLDALDAAAGFLPHRPPREPDAAEAQRAWFAARAEAAREYLTGLLVTRWPGRYCSVAVMVREIHVRGPLDVQPVVAAEWPLPTDSPDAGGTDR